MKTSKILICLIIGGIGLTSVRAQQAIVATGGTASSSNGNISYSIGQVTYTTNSNPTGSISQGVQQPYEIFTLGTDNFPNIWLNMIAYPNPTKSVINLKIDGMDTSLLDYSISDLLGKQLTQQKIHQSETQISLENLPAATYLLNVLNNNKTIKSFKIIKIN